MRRLIAVLAASALILSSVGSVAAQTTPVKPLAKGQKVVVSVSRNVVQGGKAWMTVKITRCDRTMLNKYTVVASSSLFGDKTLTRAGIVKNGSSSSKACVWRGSVAVAALQATGQYQVNFAVSRDNQPVSLAAPSKMITVRAPEASGGTDHSGGSHSSGN